MVDNRDNQSSIVSDMFRKVALSPLGDVDVYVGNRIRLLRTEHNLSISAMAKLVQTAPEDLLQYEAGKKRTPAAVLIAIAEKFKISFSKIFPSET